MYDFGILLHDLRKKKRMTQKQLADKLGVTVATVSRYESNTATPPAGHAALHFFNNERIAGRAPGNRAAIYRIRFRSEQPADRDNPQSDSVIPRPQQQVNSGDIRRKLHSARSDHR